MREFEFTFEDGMKRQACHRVRIYPHDNWTTIIATDRSVQNQCSSVTNSIDALITALVAKEGLNPERIVVIENYDDLDRETWDVVTLERRRDGTFTNPSWKAITKTEVEHWCAEEQPA